MFKLKFVLMLLLASFSTQAFAEFQTTIGYPERREVYSFGKYFDETVNITPKEMEVGSSYFIKKIEVHIKSTICFQTQCPSIEVLNSGRRAGYILGPYKREGNDLELSPNIDSLFKNVGGNLLQLKVNAGIDFVTVFVTYQKITQTEVR